MHRAIIYYFNMYKMFEFSAKTFAKNKVYNIIDGDFYRREASFV